MKSILRHANNAAAKAKHIVKLEKAAKDQLALDDARASQKAFRRAIAQTKRRNYRRTIEDWKLGPLAPKRNTGFREEKYGGINHRAITPPNIPGGKDLEDILSYHKLTELPVFRPDDRVVLLKGSEEGLIGTVNTVDDGSRTLKLKDLHKVYAYYTGTDEDWINEGNSSKTGTLTAVPLRFTDVRLVTKLPDGREVIVDRMLCKKERHESGTDIIRRYIPGTLHDIDAGRNIEPKDAAKGPPATDDYGVLDTFLDEYYVESWEPTVDLQSPPFPESVIDEVRDKYSRARQHHTAEYEAKKVALLEKIELKHEAGQIMLKTPEKQFAKEQNLAARKMAQEKVLSEKSLSLLGDFMNKHLRVSGKIQPLVSPPGSPAASASSS